MIRIICAFYSIFPIFLLKILLTAYRNTPGKIGYGIRYCILKNLAVSCGENVAIDVGVFFFHPERMSFGNNVSINPMSYLSGIGGLTIGNDVSIAHRVTKMIAIHNYEDIDTPTRGTNHKSAMIEDNI